MNLFNEFLQKTDNTFSLTDYREFKRLQNELDRKLEEIKKFRMQNELASSRINMYNDFE